MGITAITPRTNIYTSAAESLGTAADALQSTHGNLFEASDELVLEAGHNAKAAALHTLGTAGSVIMATASTAVGITSTVETASRIGAAVAIGTVGVAGKAFEGIEKGAQIAMQQMARFCSSLANVISGHLDDPQKVELSVMVLADPGAVKFSDRMFSKAGEQLKLSGEAANFSWDAYRAALGLAALSVVNTSMAGLHAGATLVNLGAAAVGAAATAPVAVAEIGLRAAKIGVQYAEKGVGLSHDAVLLAGDAAATAATALGEEKVTITPEQMKSLRTRLDVIKQKAV